MPYVLFFLLMLSINGLAQIKLPTNDIGQVQYQEIVRLSDSKRPAKQIMEDVQDWAEQYYKGNLATELQYDQEHNILFIKSVFVIDKQTVRYTLTIEPKFGRYRATLTDLITERNGLNSPVLATSPTVDDLKRVVTDSLKTNELITNMAEEQHSLYHQLDESCRATLASLRATVDEQ